MRAREAELLRTHFGDKGHEDKGHEDTRVIHVNICMYRNMHAYPAPSSPEVHPTSRVSIQRQGWASNVKGVDSNVKGVDSNVKGTYLWCWHASRACTLMRL